MSAVFLPIIVIVLFMLRQNLIVVLGIATAYAYWAFGDGVVSQALSDGNIVSLSYVVTNKTQANGASSFSSPSLLWG